MKKGISIWSFSEGTLDENFALAADAGFDDSFNYKELEVDKSQRRVKTEELLPDEAKAAFEAWKNNEGKIEY